MLHRGVALLGIFTLSPAHASLIEYSITSATTNNWGGDVHEDFGVEVGGAIADGFLFDDAASRISYAYYAGTQRLQTSGGSPQTSSNLVGWVEYCLQDWVIGPLTNGSFQVADASGYGALNRWFGMSFGDGSGIDGNLGATAKTADSVPEPTTLSLLGVGVLGALAARRRKRDADA